MSMEQIAAVRLRIIGERDAEIKALRAELEAARAEIAAVKQQAAIDVVKASMRNEDKLYTFTRTIESVEHDADDAAAAAEIGYVDIAISRCDAILRRIRDKHAEIAMPYHKRQARNHA